MSSKRKGRAGCNQATLSTTDLNLDYISGTRAETPQESGTRNARVSATGGIYEFLEAIRAAGLEPPLSAEPGQIQRFPGLGKGNRNRAAWCILFADGQAGWFGDWSSGIQGIWRADRVRPCSPALRAVLAQKAQEARQEALRTRKNRQKDAADRAAGIWASARPAPSNHPYLVRKNIRPHGARIRGAMLCLPVTDFSGNLCSLQFISPSGGKRLLSGGRKRGYFIPVAGSTSERGRTIICEGWATGCTLAENEPDARVLAAIDAGNLEPVARATRCSWPAVELIIAGDDDRLTEGNPGATKARAAAIAAGARLALPEWPSDAPHELTDFNDLARWLKRGQS